MSIEAEIIRLRELGNNRYEIKEILRSKDLLAPSATTIYNICRRHGLNRLNQSQKQEKRKIIMSRIGELAHIDCHDLSRGLTMDGGKYYLLGVIDDYGRLAWVEVLKDKKAPTVMFATLKAFNMLKHRYGVEIDAATMDDEAEFGSGRFAKNKESHPFEVLLGEMRMERGYTKPYRPETNGKNERFWKTLNEEFVEGALYENLENLKNELPGFLVYYNEHRPHSSINNIPKNVAN
ncbi:MAG: integrase core domain-containing protein [Holosporaceae bacterium]|nr:integrase core domain-containing protein [Holosporaceae bacterium]